MDGGAVGMRFWQQVGREGSTVFEAVGLARCAPCPQWTEEIEVTTSDEIYSMIARLN